MSAIACARLEARALCFARGRRPVLAGASLVISQGEIVALLGANGAGKSTLFRLMLGFEKASSGEALLDGVSIWRYSRRDVARVIAYVPQAHVTPFPYLVHDVVMLGRLPETGLFGRPGAADREIVADVLTQLGVAHLAARPYTEISGGERQLVLIGRALAQGARILVMDEPLTGLDFGYQLKMLRLLKSLAKQGRGILFSTHHPDHASKIATRVAVLQNGTIVADNAPSIVITPMMIETIYGVTLEPQDFERWERDVQASQISARQ